MKTKAKKVKKVKKVKKLTSSQVNRIWVLSEKGLSQTAIAKKIGCARSTVQSHLSNH